MIIHSLGVGRKVETMTTTEAQDFHQNNHAPLGKRSLENLGMVKYVGFYPQEAYLLSGEKLPELPWHFIVPEAYEEDFFEKFATFRDNDPVGIETVENEKKFIHRTQGNMLLNEETIYIAPDYSKVAIGIIILGKRKNSIDQGKLKELHKKSSKIITQKLNAYILDYVTYDITSCINLEKGKVDNYAYDYAGQIRINSNNIEDAIKLITSDNWSSAVASSKEYSDQKNSLIMLCTNKSYIY